MDRRKLLWLAFTGAFGLGGWALGRLVDDLRLLPYIVLPISMTAMLLIAALLFFDWQREHRRKSYPGLGVHMILRVADQQVKRRRYFFDLAGPGEAGGSFYLSASDKFVFSVQDDQGEPYNLNIPAGWRGFPIADFAYFGLEAGTDGTRTEMRASLNGRMIFEQTLPFPITFPDPGNAVIGANRRGEENAAFGLAYILTLDRTLDYEETGDLTRYMRQRVPA